VRLRDKLLAGVGDLLERALDVLIVAIPLRERGGVVLHATGKFLLQFGLTRQAAEDRLERAELREELLPGGAGLIEPILRFLPAHGEERQQQLLAVGLGDPGHAVIDRLLDIGSDIFKPLAGSLIFREAELGLLVDQVAERKLELAELLAHQVGVVFAQRPGRSHDLLEVRRCENVIGFEVLDQVGRGHRDKIGGSKLHGHQRDLEFAACVGQDGRCLDVVERVGHLALSGGEREAVRNEADNWNQRDPDDAGPDRDR
jgi:hypothetical protein